MFDRTVILPTRTEYVTRTTHEHRAPTDESVKILREMEAKARDGVLSAIHIKDTEIHGVVFYEPFNNRVTVRVKVNGRTIDASVERTDTPQELHAELSRAIAAELLTDTMRSDPTIAGMFR